MVDDAPQALAIERPGQREALVDLFFQCSQTLRRRPSGWRWRRSTLLNRRLGRLSTRLPLPPLTAQNALGVRQAGFDLPWNVGVPWVVVEPALQDRLVAAALEPCGVLVEDPPEVAGGRFAVALVGGTAGRLGPFTEAQLVSALCPSCTDQQFLDHGAPS